MIWMRLLSWCKNKSKQISCILITPREREHTPRRSLAQDAVEALDVARPPRAFVRRSVLCLGQNFGIGRPKTRVQEAAFAEKRNTLPKQAASDFVVVVNSISDDLTRSSALGQSHPALVLAKAHEGPHLAYFQHDICLGLNLSGLEPASGSGAAGCSLFLATG